MMEFNFNSFGNSTQLMSYCDPEECEENKKLKQALKKIKEIAESQEYVGFNELQIEEILKKINEVAND